MGTNWRKDPQDRGIYRKRNVYWLKVSLRPDERHQFNGKPVKWYNLKTPDKGEAIRRANVIKEQWRRKRDDHSWPDHIPRDPAEPPDGQTLEEWAMSLRGEKHRFWDGGVYTSEGKWIEPQEFEEDVVDIVADGDALEKRWGYERTKRFVAMARGNLTPASEVLGRYAKETQVSETSMSGKAWAFRTAGLEFLEDAATRRKAGDIVEKLTGNYSQHSVKTIVKDLRAVYGFATDRGLIEVNPWMNLKVAAGKTEKREVTREELKLIMETTRDEQTKDTAQVIFLLCHTGLRLGEFIALRQDYVEYTSGGLFLHVRKSKTAAGVRKVPVPSSCHHIIEKLRGNKAKLYPFGKTTLQEKGRKVLNLCLGEAAKEVDMHSCRRSYATALLHCDIPEAIAARLEGHRHERMTYGLYAGEVLDRQLLAAAEKVGEYFG